MPNKFICGKNNSGFSLLEFLIVIVIFGILTMIVSYNLVSFYNRKNLDNDTEKIAYTLRSARDKSIVQDESSQWGVHFENPASGVGFFEIFKGAAYSSSTVSFRKTLHPGNQFSDPAASSSKNIIFSKIEGLPPSASLIIISLKNNPTASRTITVLSRGEIQY